jgi:hypothetical protein
LTFSQNVWKNNIFFYNCHKPLCICTEILSSSKGLYFAFHSVTVLNSQSACVIHPSSWTFCHSCWSVTVN